MLTNDRPLTLRTHLLLSCNSSKQIQTPHYLLKEDECYIDQQGRTLPCCLKTLHIICFPEMMNEAILKGAVLLTHTLHNRLSLHNEVILMTMTTLLG